MIDMGVVSEVLEFCMFVMKFLDVIDIDKDDYLNL